MKVFDRAVALLQDWDEATPRLLFLKNEKQKLELIWCQRLCNETYRQGLTRELNWQLSLDNRRDYIICSTPRLNLWVDPESWEPIDRDDADKREYGVLEVYPVQLFGKRSRGILDELKTVQFLSPQELHVSQRPADMTRQTDVLIKWLDLVREDYYG